MTIELVSEARLGSTGNEDLAGYANGAAWILDGASVPASLAGDGPDARWYVQRLSASIAQGLIDGDDRKLRELVGAAIATVAAAGQLVFPRKQDAAWPSATVALVRLRDGALDYFVLGDSPLLIAGIDGVELIADRQLRQVAPDLRARIRKLLGAGGGYESEEHQRLVRELVVVEREMRNVEGGYWIASADPAATDRGVTGSIPPGEATAIALLTDGMARALDPLRLEPSPGTLMERLLRPGGPAACLRAVRQSETGDPDGRHYPRTTVSDDATALVWSDLPRH